MPICISPRSSAVSTSAEVRCGTTIIGMPDVVRSSSPVTFWVLPGLMVPTLNFCGSARATSNACFSVRSGESALTSTNRSNCAMVEMGANAVTGSNGIDLSSDFDNAMPLEKTNKV